MPIQNIITKSKHFRNHEFGYPIKNDTKNSYQDPKSKNPNIKFLTYGQYKKLLSKIKTQEPLYRRNSVPILSMWETWDYEDKFSKLGLSDNNLIRIPGEQANMISDVIQCYYDGWKYARLIWKNIIGKDDNGFPLLPATSKFRITDGGINSSVWTAIGGRVEMSGEYQYNHSLYDIIISYINDNVPSYSFIPTVTNGKISSIKLGQEVYIDFNKLNEDKGIGDMFIMFGMQDDDTSHTVRCEILSNFQYPLYDYQPKSFKYTNYSHISVLPDTHENRGTYATINKNSTEETKKHFSRFLDGIQLYPDNDFFGEIYSFLNDSEYNASRLSTQQINLRNNFALIFINNKEILDVKIYNKEIKTFINGIPGYNNINFNDDSIYPLMMIKRRYEGFDKFEIIKNVDKLDGTVIPLYKL